jgi:hypothetical protein
VIKKEKNNSLIHFKSEEEYKEEREEGYEKKNKVDKGDG